MKIKSISIANFRKLTEISFTCSKTISTIVGPNGVGKSSIIDAIRIVKAVLLQTIDNEAMSTLQNMGVFAPQTGAILFETICGDNRKETTIELVIEIHETEISRLKGDLENFSLQRLTNQLGQVGLSRLNLVPFLSSPVGRNKQKEVLEETQKLLAEIEKNQCAIIKLTVQDNQISGMNGFDQEITAYLLRSPDFSDTLFTVFPADRSLPTGDPNVQLGQAEIGNQMHSYSIQPQLKFSRLKAAIISYLMLNENDITPIRSDFQLIFNNLLPGKELAGVNIEPRIGKVSVLIKETAAGKVYDIDFLSSGEKGLLLTFFLLLRTVREGGIVLLDEPELHLNPSVCKRIIPFLREYICKKKNAQIILATHSAEILADTKEDDHASLWHLIDGKTITPILKRDNEEAQEAIKSLGITTSDLLFNRGVVYLEGIIDEEYIDEILKGLVDGFKIQSLGGRNSVENEIAILQSADRDGKLKGYHVFILDHDNKPTEYKDSPNVRIIQWDKYSLENYFIDTLILYDVVKDNNPKNFPSVRTTFTKDVESIAFEQIPQLAIFTMLEQETPHVQSLTKKEIREKTIQEISRMGSHRVAELISLLNNFNETNWQTEFTNKVESEISRIKADWRQSWASRCNGKELLLAIYEKYSLHNFKHFVKMLISVNKSENSDNWRALKEKLGPVFQH